MKWFGEGRVQIVYDSLIDYLLLDPPTDLYSIKVILIICTYNKIIHEYLNYSEVVVP